ncbi:PP2C family protein-serine/threonine phosphatase [Desulfotalea psychrophila]|uniref:Related to serine/threonine protein phosphatase n=1 Tax=Desulfotalea psychrophila (strain LSv54 / DSM 12343) TaxID=177439 RepID=Q6AK23_DESPS|nr:PP2C family serine/threonine-protein phosphatase [Desulfotalea psychrophila]CAG37303.1 related to serine/threonine protein phosphatase [Desulfotalea psychrophila LSv54]
MIQFCQITDIGRVRDHNEDSLMSDADRGVWVIADGMGGYEAGEVASAIVVEAFSRLSAEGMALSEVLAETHHCIHRAVEQGQGSAGMGSTAVSLKLIGSNYEIAWVGDSRAYLYDNHSLIQLTRDHSYVQQLVDAGAITTEEAVAHPQRNAISQALGAEMKEVKPDSVKGRLGKGDRLLLCSDGLTSELSDAEIASILSLNQSPETILQQLVQAANDRGGSDNITIIMVDAPEDAPVRGGRGATRPMNAVDVNRIKKTRKKNRAPFYALAGFLLAAIPVVLCFCLGQGSFSPAPIHMQKTVSEIDRADLQDLLPETSAENGSDLESREISRVGLGELEQEITVDLIPDERGSDESVDDFSGSEAEIVNPAPAIEKVKAVTSVKAVNGYVVSAPVLIGPEAKGVDPLIEQGKVNGN